MNDNQPKTFAEYMADDNRVSPADRERIMREVAEIGKKIEAKTPDDFDRLLEKHMKNPEFKSGYEAMEPEFKAIQAEIDSRSPADRKATQREAAELCEQASVLAAIYDERYRTKANPGHLKRIDALLKQLKQGKVVFKHSPTVDYLDSLGTYGEYGRNDKAYYLYDLGKAGTISPEEAWALYEDCEITEVDLKEKFQE